MGTPLAPTAQDDYIKPYTVREIDGARVGIIGIDIANKTRNSSSPLETTEFLDEQATAQAMIDELTGSGINKIILLTHYQYQNDLELANRLSGVDVIIGGDSHSLLGDFSAYGLESSGPYPTLTTNADGDQVCVAQAWQYSWVVGELSVEWNDEGVVQSCNGVPHLLLDEPLVREDANEEEYELTGTEIRSVLNEAVDYAHTDSSGAYPYAAGLRWYVDMNRSAGTRLHDIEYRERNEGAWLPLNDDTRLTVVSKPSMDEYSTQNYTAAP